MNKFNCIVNDKATSKVVNVLANTTGMIATAFAVILLVSSFAIYESVVVPSAWETEQNK